jgi:hypothetical protein
VRIGHLPAGRAGNICFSGVPAKYLFDFTYKRVGARGSFVFFPQHFLPLCLFSEKLLQNVPLSIMLLPAQHNFYLNWINSGRSS